MEFDFRYCNQGSDIHNVSQFYAPYNYWIPMYYKKAMIYDILVILHCIAFHSLTQFFTTATMALRATCA